MPKKVKWAISILLVCIAVLLLALPKLTGVVIQDAIADGVFEQIRASTEEQVIITNSQIETGWFSSIIQLSIEISDAQHRTEPYSLLLRGTIRHGPILLTQSELAFGLVSLDVALNTDTLESEVATIILDNLVASIIVKFDQSLAIRASVSDISILNADENLHATISKLAVYLDISQDFAAQADIELSRILIENIQSNIRLTFSNPSLRLETARLDDVSAASQISATIPSIIASEPLAFIINNTNLEWRSYPSNENVELTDFSQFIQVDKIESELPLESVSWKSEMRGVKQELIRSYNEMLSNIQSMSGIDPISRVAELTRIGNETGLILIQNQVNIINVIEAKLYQGKHRFEINALWEGLPSVSNLENLTFEGATEALNVDVNVSLDQDSVSISPFAELAEHYISQNYLISSGDQLTFRAQLEKGSVTLNDENIPLEQFLQ